MTTALDVAGLPQGPAEARRRGSKHYFTGKPCRFGHIAPRYTTNSKCAICMRDEVRRYYARHADHRRETHREWSRANAEQNRRQTAEYSARLAKAKAASGFTNADAKRVFERYGNRCAACGTESRLVLDHVIPLIHGGAHSESNLQVLCVSCNSKKGIKSTRYEPWSKK